MASKFLVPDRDQSFLRVASYRDLLGDDGLVWTVIGVVEGLDLSAVYARYGDDIGQGGRPAFDPAMMLTLLVFGYCEGRRSARELETACRRDVAYQAICGGMVPDHATITRFRVMIDDVVESLFVQVLAACRERGLVDVGRVALDGTKIGAAASKDANRSVERLSELEIQIRQILAETVPDVDDSPSSAAVDDAVVDDAAVDGAGAGGGGWSGVRRRAEDERRLGRIGAAQAEAERSRLRREHDQKRRGRKRGGRAVGNTTDPDSRACQVFCVRLWFMLSGRGVRGR